MTMSASPPERPAKQPPGFVNWMGSLWGYTLLRFALFFALWGLLVLFKVDTLFAALVAAVLSIPLGLVLLAGPRRRVAEQVERRMEAAREARRDLDSRLDPDHENPDR